MFGTAGLPHILMRFFTVADAKAARKSVFYATGFIGYFYILTFIIGFGAIVLVSTNPEYLTDAAKGLTAIKGTSNMAAIHLANAVGGNVFLGFISAVAFATILAVVSGLTLSGASAISHDLYATVIKGGKANEQDEIWVSKAATIALGIIAVILGIVFEKQNVAFMVGLAFSIAASCNFPVLLMSIMWKGMTTRGAVIGGFLGLISALVGVVLSPSVWEATMGNPKGSALFQIANPALFSMALAFIGIWLFSSHRSRLAARKTRTASTRNMCARRPASALPARPRTKPQASRARNIRARLFFCGRTPHSLSYGQPGSPGTCQEALLPKSFDASGAPFDRLSPQETENLRAAIDIVYFRPDETIIAQDGGPAGLFVVIKGCVEDATAPN